jgi:hypothetical protein
MEFNGHFGNIKEYNCFFLLQKAKPESDLDNKNTYGSDAGGQKNYRPASGTL